MRGSSSSSPIGPVAERRVALHLLDHELAGVAGADDDHVLAAAATPGSGFSISVRARSREPATKARQRSMSTNQTPRGTATRWTSKSVKTRKTATEASATPRSTVHMSRVET